MKKKKVLLEEQMVSFSRRALLVGGLQIGALGLIVKHLYNIQVSESQKYSSLSDSNRFNYSLIPSSRGAVFDRKCRILATNTGSFDIQIVPEWSRDIQETLYNLSKFISIDENEIKTILNIAQKQKSKEITNKEAREICEKEIKKNK